LPWLGFVPDEVAPAPAAAVGRLPLRLGIAVGELRGTHSADIDGEPAQLDADGYRPLRPAASMVIG
jgi:hypothetical protein